MHADDGHTRESEDADRHPERTAVQLLEWLVRLAWVQVQLLLRDGGGVDLGAYARGRRSVQRIQAD